MLLCACGVALTYSGHLNPIIEWTWINHVTVPLWANAEEHLPRYLFEFIADWYRFAGLTPFFFGAGILAGLVMKFRVAFIGVWLPIAFSVWGNALRFNWYLQDLEQNQKNDMLPFWDWWDFTAESTWFSFYTPIFVLAVAIGHRLRTWALPSWRIRDLLAIAVFVAIQLACIESQVRVVPQLLLLIGLTFAAYRGWATCRVDAPTITNPSTKGSEVSKTQ